MDPMTKHQTRRRLVGGLIVALACVFAVVSESAQTQRRHGKLSGRAQLEARRGGSQKINVMVRFRQRPGALDKALVQSLGGKVGRQFRSSSRWLSLRLPAHLVEKLADHPNVEFVAADPQVSAAMDVARQAAGEPPATAPESMLKGAGVGVAVVDSGVALHPEIGTLVAAVDFVGTGALGGGLPGEGDGPSTAPANSIDPYGHGTHVAGIIVGNGSHSPEAKHAGIAPEASLVSVRVLGADGSGTTSDVIAGLEWIAQNKDVYGIRVVNMSLGHPVYESAADDPLVQAVESLWDAGIVVVCS